MIERLGVTIETGKRLGRDYTLDSLRAEGYEAVFLGVGCPEGTRLGIPGEDASGVIDSLDFLRTYNTSGKADVGRQVAVIGGGNAAIDAARTALRLGAEKVTLVYRRTRAQMPAWEEEIAAAEEEGVELMTLVAPMEIIKDHGKARGLKCRRQILGDYDKSGRRRPVAGSQPDFILDCDQVIAAIGQKLDLAPLLGSIAVETTKGGTPVYDALTGQMSEPWLFVGGDSAMGPSSVVDAVAGGEKAAAGIDSYLTGANHAFWRRTQSVDTHFDPDVDPVSYPRAEIPVLAARQRRGNFQEVEQSWSPAVALHEAKRCLRCDYGKTCDLDSRSH
jgi:NADH-quinone oxidoreductase subunit F